METLFRLGKRVPDAIGRVCVAADGDERAAHPLIKAHQGKGGHIFTKRSAEPRCVDLQGDAALDDHAEDLTDLFLEAENIDVSFVFAVDIAQGASEVRQHVEIRFFNHLAHLRKVFPQKSMDLFLRHRAEIHAGIGIRDIYIRNTVHGAEDHVVMTKAVKKLRLFGSEKIFRHLDALQKLQLSLVFFAKRQDFSDAGAKALMGVLSFIKPHIRVVADGNAEDALFDGRATDLLNG